MPKSLVIPIIFLFVTSVTNTAAQVANKRVAVDKWWAGQNVQQIREETTEMDFNLRLKNQSGKTIDAIKWDVVIVDEHALSDKDRVFKRLTYRDGYLKFKTGEKKKLTRAEDLPEVVKGKRGQYTYVIEGFLVTYEDGTKEYIICSTEYIFRSMPQQREEEQQQPPPPDSSSTWRTYTMTWSGTVDGIAEVLIRGSSMSVRNLSIHEVRDANASFSGDIPFIPKMVSLVPISARGSIRLEQRPSSENDYTTIVRIDDSGYEGGKLYEFKVIWLH